MNPESPGAFVEWVGAVRDLGGWGVAGLFFGLYVWQLRVNLSKDARIFGYLEDANAALKVISGKGETQAALPPKEPP